MQNLFLAAINHVADLSGNKYNISERSTGHAPGSRLTDFDPFWSFCLFLLLDDRNKTSYLLLVNVTMK